MRRKLFLVFLIAFLARVSFFFFSPYPKHPVGDGVVYDILAKNIAQKGIPAFFHGYNSRRSPAYPVFLAVVYKLLGVKYGAVLLIQSLLSATVPVVIFLIARKFFDFKIAFFSSAAALFYPVFIYYGGVMLSEAIFLPLFLAAMFFMVSYYYDAKRRDLLLFSITVSAAIYARPTAFLLIPAVLIWFYVGGKNMAGILFAVFLSALFLFPWTLRNYIVCGKIIPFTTEGAVTFYFSNNKYSDGSGPYRKEVYEDYKREKSGIIEAYPDEGERYEYMIRKTVRFIKNNPKFFLMLAADKFCWFWKIVPHTDNRIEKVASVLSYGFILPFFLFGFFAAFFSEKRNEILIFHIVIILFTLFHITFAYGSTRFRLPVEPCIVILGVYGFFRLSDFLRRVFLGNLNVSKP